jgi:hypothetical protein
VSHLIQLTGGITYLKLAIIILLFADLIVLLVILRRAFRTKNEKQIRNTIISLFIASILIAFMFGKIVGQLELIDLVRI